MQEENTKVICGCCGRSVDIHTTIKVGVSVDVFEYVCEDCLLLEDLEDGEDLS